MGAAEKQTMIIFTQRLAGYLMLHGFVLLGIDRDKKKPERNIFIFNDSEQIRDRIGEYINSYR